MKPRKFKFHDGVGGAALAIRVTPRAKKEGISGILPDGTVKIRLTAPPVEGKANRALIELLSRILSLPATNFEIIAGESSRNKIVSILGIEAQQLQDKLLEYLGKK